MIVYLAHPIDLDRAAVSGATVYDIKNALVDSGMVVYDPAEAFRMGSSGLPTPEVSRVNQTALEQASAFVILYPEAKTIGTVLELAYAVGSGKPTMVVSKALDLSWALAGLTDYSNVYLAESWTSHCVSWIEDSHLNLRDASKTHLKYMFNPSAGPDAVLAHYGPDRNYDGDAGFDLYVTEDVEIPIGQFRDIPCGINVELPEATWGLIIGRSSTLRKHNLMVTPGVIDNGYRGPLYAGVYNMDGAQFSAKRGMRLAQFIPFPLTAQNMVPRMVPLLSDSDRGSRGFGSTGE